MYVLLFNLSLTDVKYEVLSLGCRKGDLEWVKMMINKYDCDPKGLWFITPRQACCQFCIKLLNVERTASQQNFHSLTFY